MNIHHEQIKPMTQHAWNPSFNLIWGWGTIWRCRGIPTQNAPQHCSTWVMSGSLSPASLQFFSFHFSNISSCLRLDAGGPMSSDFHPTAITKPIYMMSIQRVGYPQLPLLRYKRKRRLTVWIFTLTYSHTVSFSLSESVCSFVWWGNFINLKKFSTFHSLPSTRAS